VTFSPVPFLRQKKFFIFDPDFFEKKQQPGFVISKKYYICSLKSKSGVTQYIYEDEKDISAIKKEKSQQTWFQGKNVNPQWKKGSCCPQGKRKEEINRFIRAEIESIALLMQYLRKGATHRHLFLYFYVTASPDGVPIKYINNESLNR